MVPAMAVPSEEPRLDTLRDRPEISPCSLLGEARLHDVDRRREHHAEPQADQEQARARRPRRSAMPVTMASSTPMPAIVTTKPGRMRVRCARRFASRSAASDDSQQADRGGGEDHAGLDRVVAAHDLQVGRDHERRRP